MLGAFRRRKQLIGARGKSLFVELNQFVFKTGKDVLLATFEQLKQTGITGLILNKGILKEFYAHLSLDWKIIVQLSAASKHGLPYYNRTLICTVAEALRLGADAVSVQLILGNDLEDKMLQDLSLVVDDAHQLGIPVLVDLRPQGGQIVNEFDRGLLDYCLGMGVEWGADLIAINIGKKDTASNFMANCPVPLLVKFSHKNLDYCYNFIQKNAPDQWEGICLTDVLLEQDSWSEDLAKLKSKLERRRG